MCFSSGADRTASGRDPSLVVAFICKVSLAWVGMWPVASRWCVLGLSVGTCAVTCRRLLGQLCSVGTCAVICRRFLVTWQRTEESLLLTPPVLCWCFKFSSIALSFCTHFMLWVAGPHQIQSSCCLFPKSQAFEFPPPSTLVSFHRPSSGLWVMLILILVPIHRGLNLQPENAHILLW